MTIMRKWSDVLTIVSGKNQKSVINPNGKYPIYGSGGIIGYADDYLCEPGTTVIGRKGTINSPIFVNERFWNVDTAFGIAPGKDLIPKFLYYFCLLYNFKSLDKSTTIPSLSKHDLLSIEMPVPHIAEQQRIVTRIEELFSDLDKAVETMQTIKQQLAVYRHAVLKDAFKSTSDFKPIFEMSSLVTSGSRGWAKYYSDEGAEFIRIGNLTRTGIDIDFSNIQHVSLPERAEGTRTRLQANDVLVSITADLGSIGLVPQTIDEAYINQHIALIRFNNPSQGKLLAWFLRSELGQKSLLMNKRGGGKLGLGLDDIRESKVPNILDSIADAILSSIESQVSVCESIEKTVNTALNQAALLRYSILRNCFGRNE